MFPVPNPNSQMLRLMLWGSANNTRPAGSLTSMALFVLRLDYDIHENFEPAGLSRGVDVKQE